MNQQSLSSFIWSVADLLRGDYKQSDYGKVILPRSPWCGRLNNTKEQFGNSPGLNNELMNAIMDALAAHNTMSKRALESERVRSGLRDILLGPAQLYESLRERTGSRSEAAP